MSWRLDSACSVSPAMNSSATWRLNAALCDRCFVMVSILRKPDRGGQIQDLKLSTRRGALHNGVLFPRRNTAKHGACETFRRTGRLLAHAHEHRRHADAPERLVSRSAHAVAVVFLG